MEDLSKQLADLDCKLQELGLMSVVDKDTEPRLAILDPSDQTNELDFNQLPLTIGKEYEILDEILDTRKWWKFASKYSFLDDNGNLINLDSKYFRHTDRYLNVFKEESLLVLEWHKRNDVTLRPKGYQIKPLSNKNMLEVDEWMRLAGLRTSLDFDSLNVEFETIINKLLMMKTHLQKECEHVKQINKTNRLIISQQDEQIQTLKEHIKELKVENEE